MPFSFLLLGLCSFTLWITYQDLSYRKIPNLCLIGLGLFLFCHLLIGEVSFWPHLKAGFLGLGISVLILFFPKWTSYVGAGDLKLFSIACFFTLPQTLPLFMILSGLLALVWGVLYQTIFKQNAFPLGPALMLGLIITLSL